MAEGNLGQDLESAIGVLAGKSAGAAASAAESYASAARQLAEALAWLKQPGQPH